MPTTKTTGFLTKWCLAFHQSYALSFIKLLY
jgi:hypothetical protein